MAKSNAFKMKLPSVDDLFSTEESRQEVKLKKLYDIPLSEIDDFPDHPYRVVDDDDMKTLMDSIEVRGVITPAMVRKKDGGRYEMISGHRRKYACEHLGLETIRCEVVEVSRDEAIILMVDSNSQRSEIAPCDKGRAYKMKLEAMNRQGNIKTNWNNQKFHQTLSGNFYLISYIDVVSGKKYAGSTWYFANSESEKSIKDNYYIVDFPDVEYNVSINNISQETGKISGKIALKQRFYFHDFSDLKNGFEEIPFEVDFDVETGNFSVTKAFNTVCYRQDTFQNTYKDITYVPVELKFDFGFGGYSEKGSWGFNVSLHNIQIGNKIQCSYDEYTRAKYPWK